MNKMFIESKGFTEWVVKVLDEQAYAVFQQRLLNVPDCGAVMPARVIYLHVPEANWIFLLDGYEKAEKEDLSPAEKRILKRLADELKAEARRAAERGGSRRTP